MSGWCERGTSPSVDVKSCIVCWCVCIGVVSHAHTSIPRISIISSSKVYICVCDFVGGRANTAFCSPLRHRRRHSPRPCLRPPSVSRIDVASVFLTCFTFWTKLESTSSSLVPVSSKMITNKQMNNIVRYRTIYAIPTISLVAHHHILAFQRRLPPTNQPHLEQQTPPFS